MFKGLWEFFGYSKTERRGIYALLIVIFTLLITLYFDDFFYKEEEIDFSSFRSALAEIEKNKSITNALELDQFDPNIISFDDLVAYGLNTVVARRMVNYVKKGGSFSKPEDVLKIYGMDSVWYEKAKSFMFFQNVSIHKKQDNPETVFSFQDFDPNTVSQADLEQMGLKPYQARNIISYREKYKAFENNQDVFQVYGIDTVMANKMIPFIKIAKRSVSEKYKDEYKEKVFVNINKADSLELISVKGIGAYTANKILKERELLGGFHSTQQLIDIYPIDIEKYEKLKDQIFCKGDFRQMDLNNANYNELVKHPYINKGVAESILNFRNNIRPFIKVEELKQLEYVDSVLYLKIMPYFYAGSN